MQEIYQWDDQQGCVPFSTSATGVWTPGSAQQTQMASYFCARCGRPMVRRGSVRFYFQHSNLEDEGQCGRQHAANVSDLPSLASPQLSIGLRYTENSINLYLSFYSVISGSAYPNGAKIIIRAGRNTTSHAATLLARNKGTMLRAPALAASYTITYQGFREDNTRYWPEKVDGPDPDGAFFDASYRLLRPGTRIPLDTSKVYYFLTVHPVEEVSADLRLRHLCAQPMTRSISWHLYRVSVQHFSLSAAAFFLEHGIFPAAKRPAFTPVWPPCIEQQNFLLHHAGSLYFALTNTDAALRTNPRKLARKINDVPSKSVSLYQVSTNLPEELVAPEGGAGLGFYWCRQTALRGKAVPPKVSVSDSSGNLLEEDALKALESGSLVIQAPFNGMVQVYQDQILRCVYPLRGGQDAVLSALPADGELRIYQGTDLVRTLRFGAEVDKAREREKLAAQEPPLKTPAELEAAEKAPPSQPERTPKSTASPKAAKRPAPQAPQQPEVSPLGSGSPLAETIQVLKAQKSGVSTEPSFPEPSVLPAAPPEEMPKAEPKPSVSPSQQNDVLLARLRACTSRPIPISHAFGACAALFSPAVQRWIAGKVREQKMPADAYRLLVYESNLRQGGQRHGR